MGIRTLFTFHAGKDQRKLLPPANEVWGKVMFLHLSVSHLLTGGCIPACTGADTPWADISQHALGQTPPGQTYPSMHWADTPRQTTPAVDGRHPTGMHSCRFFFCVRFLSVWMHPTNSFTLRKKTNVLANEKPKRTSQTDVFYEAKTFT